MNWEQNYGHQRNNNSDNGLNLFDPSWWTTDYHVIVYATGIAILTVLVICGNFAYYRMCLQISFNLHEKLYHGVTRAMMFFFHRNSTGRILNRFSKDMGAIDSTLPVVVIDCIKVSFKFNY